MNGYRGDGLKVSSVLRSFRENFYTLVCQIPEGRVSTYGSLARALGSERAARAVGKMLNENPRPVEVPCHRVVRSDGSLGDYAKGKKKKKRLLKQEGIEFEDEKVRDFKEIVFEDFESDRPLERLREEQSKLKEKITIPEKSDREFSSVAGVDVSYSNGKAYPAISLWDNNTREEIDILTTEVDIEFPYIPTFLAFREMPCLLEIIKEVEDEPDVVMVDGNGVMHPEGTGLASHLGVEAEIPTIGVAKSKLCGDLVDEVDRERGKRVSEVRDNRKLIGHAVLEGDRAKNPIYVSAGHKVSHQKSVELVRSYCRYKVPDPIRRAHIEATKRRKKDER